MAAKKTLHEIATIAIKSGSNPAVFIPVPGEVAKIVLVFLMFTSVHLACVVVFNVVFYAGLLLCLLGQALRFPQLWRIVRPRGWASDLAVIWLAALLLVKEKGLSHEKKTLAW